MSISPSTGRKNRHPSRATFPRGGFSSRAGSRTDDQPRAARTRRSPSGWILVRGKRRVVIARVNNHDFGGIRTKNAPELASLKLANTQDFEGIEMARFDQGIEIIVGECRGIHAPSLANRSQRPRSKTKILSPREGPARLPLPTGVSAVRHLTRSQRQISARRSGTNFFPTGGPTYSLRGR